MPGVQEFAWHGSPWTSQAYTTSDTTCCVGVHGLLIQSRCPAPCVQGQNLLMAYSQDSLAHAGRSTYLRSALEFVALSEMVVMAGLTCRTWLIAVSRMNAHPPCRTSTALYHAK